MDALWTTLLRAPNGALFTGICASALALLLWLWLLRRALRRRFTPTPGTRGRGGVFLFLVSLAIAALGASALLLSALLGGYRSFSRKVRIAELQCIESEPGSGQLRLYYVPIDLDGARGATAIRALTGDTCVVGAHIVRPRAWFDALGVGPTYVVTHFAGAWKNADPKHPKSNRIEVGGNRVWLAAESDGVRGPLAMLVRDVPAQVIPAAPDRRAVYELFVSPSGYTIERRSY